MAGKATRAEGEHPLRTDANFCVNELFRLRTKRDKPPLRKRRRIDISSSTQCVDGRIRLRVVYAVIFASCRFRVVFAAFGGSIPVLRHHPGGGLPGGGRSGWPFSLLGRRARPSRPV